MPSAPKEIIDLVAAFGREQRGYLAREFNESQVRLEYIDPFLTALGWDISNKNHVAPDDRDVVVEAAAGGDEGGRTPDYTFRNNRETIFFVEAKRPQVDIAKRTDTAYQVRSYGWNAGLKCSILTDFQEFAVYDCLPRPTLNAQASEARVLYVSYDQYITRWDEIASVFSRAAVRQGDYTRWVNRNTGTLGTLTVDAAFLKDMSIWRELLAANLALRNPALNEQALNYAVQLTLDRIVFLRICEDRGIEISKQLLNVSQDTGIYPRLLELFHRADRRYNSGLFHFRAEKERTSADTLTPTLTLDDQELREIINKLYWPSPYNFKIMPVEILGQVYEQFLGSVIHLSASHEATIEQKPEVKKAGGVYYTPKYIVQYIVKHTVGELIKDKTPQEIKELAICDPACGSGSFLLGAYECLLDYYLDWHTSHPSKQARKELVRAGDGWRLTVVEKKRILVQHLYGVDIDTQAVEVTKLSLLLKVLEGETKATLQLELMPERVLPELSNNIKCGNSLIGWDYPGAANLSADESQRINPFDWHSEFPQVFARGGFDAVIGNPPYGLITDKNQLLYLRSKYQNLDSQCDNYLLFLDFYEYILQQGGLLGVIVSNTWLQSITMKKIRHYLVTSYTWRRVLVLVEKVFQAVVDTNVFIFQKQHSEVATAQEIIIDVRDKEVIRYSHSLQQNNLPVNGDPINIIATQTVHELIKRLQNISTPLNAICEIYNGIKPFEKGKGTPPQTDKTMIDKPFVVEGDLPSLEWSPLLRGSLIFRYRCTWSDNYWVKYGPWLAGENNLHIILPRDYSYNLRYLLGLLNSKLLDFIYTFINPEKGEALAEIKKQHVEWLPIYPIDFSSPAGGARHDRMVQLVERMLQLHKDLASAATPHNRELLARQITATDAAIDRLVYELYELTPEEIALVEA